MSITSKIKGYSHPFLRGAKAFYKAFKGNGVDVSTVSYTKIRAHLTIAELDHLLDTIPVGLHALSSDGVITTVNATESRMLGFSRSEMVGHLFLDFISPEQREEAWGRFQLKLMGEKVEKTVGRTYRTKDGRDIFVTSEDTVIAGRNGEVRWILSALIDISELKEAQDRIFELRKLEGFRRIAEGVSHEVNNLFAMVASAASLLGRLASEVDAERAGRMIDVVDGSRSRITELTGVLKRAAFSEPGQYFMTRLDLREIVTKALAEFESGANGITIRSRMEKCRVKGEGDDLIKALKQILKNAREAIESAKEAPEYKGEIRVEVRPSNLTKKVKVQGGDEIGPGKYALIQIRDNGSGIPKAQQLEIFDPFFTTKGSSQGLGLFEVLGIVRNAGGGITFTSEEGKGSVFRIYFPLEELAR